MGYYVDWVSLPGPDRGIDIIAYTDPIGVKGPRLTTTSTSLLFGAGRIETKTNRRIQQTP
jgi:restriction system protein